MTNPTEGAGWWEEYRCGCVSETVPRKRDLLGYCGRHGDNRRLVVNLREVTAARRTEQENRDG